MLSRVAFLPAAAFALGCATTVLAAGLVDLTGVVRDGAGRPVAGATVALATGPATTSGRDGAFRLRVPAGPVTLRATFPGAVAAEVHVDARAGGDPVELRLDIPPVTESVVVHAIRATDDTPVTKTELSRADIERESYGQELPFLLQDTPSLTYYADAGLGAGYSYLYLRGIQQTRVNFTFDGVPLNEPEDSATYFADYANLQGSLQGVQVQRGVGTSTFGAAAFAGSVAFTSVDPAPAPGVSFEGGAGSYGTRRASLGWDSGTVGGRYAFYARGSYHDTDGYREHAGVEQQSVFFGATARGADSFLKVSGFVGRERSQLAFYAVAPGVLEENPRANPLRPEERDDFSQALVQATWTKALSSESSLSLQGYYQTAGGWYRLHAADGLGEYGLHWGFGGLTGAYATRLGATRLVVGASANAHASRHTRDVLGAAEGGGDRRAYTDRGAKSQGNVFAKGEHRFGRVTLFADAQLRYVRFRNEGAGGTPSASWTFFNPKLGARYAPGDRLSFYASAGRTGREPQRADLLSGSDEAPPGVDFGAVRPEEVVNVEVGADYRRTGLALHANLYAMEFRDELALTGELSEIGLPTRANVDRSTRRGLEIDASWQVAPRVRLTAAASVSRNRYGGWTQFYDRYDADGNAAGSTARTYVDVEPLLTPSFGATAGVAVTPAPWVTLGAGARHVAAAYLDNVNDDARRTPSFTTADASATVRLGAARLRLQVDNLFDEPRVWPSGYSYLYAIRDGAGNESLAGIPYYYPLAGRTFFLGLEFGR